MLKIINTAWNKKKAIGSPFLLLGQHIQLLLLLQTDAVLPWEHVHHKKRQLYSLVITYAITDGPAVSQSRKHCSLSYEYMKCLIHFICYFIHLFCLGDVTNSEHINILTYFRVKRMKHKLEYFLHESYSISTVQQDLAHRWLFLLFFFFSKWLTLYSVVYARLSMATIQLQLTGIKPSR